MNDIPIPKVLETVFEDVPGQVKRDIDDGVDKLLALPIQIDRDLAELVVVTSKVPNKVADVLYQLPGQTPSNIDAFMETVKEGLEYGDLPEAQRGERLRRITDLIPGI